MMVDELGLESPGGLQNRVVVTSAGKHDVRILQVAKRERELRIQAPRPHSQKKRKEPKTRRISFHGSFPAIKLYIRRGQCSIYTL